jgi:hypothetical protein
VYPENEELGFDDIPFQMVGGLSEGGKLWVLNKGKQLGASLLFIIIFYYLLLFIIIYYYLLLFIIIYYDFIYYYLLLFIIIY